jgi:dipeptidyl aminopeptidase/acylaminoacyl peptidase
MVRGAAKRTFRAVGALTLGFLAAATANSAAVGPAPLRPITTRDLATIADIKSVSISPDTHKLVYQIYQANLEQNSYDITWHVLPLSHQGRVEPSVFIASGGEPIFGLLGVVGGGINGEFYGSQAIWSPDSSWFAYTLKKAGEIQLWMSRADRPGQQQITHNAADVRYAAWSKDGSRIYFTVDRTRTRYEELERQQQDQGYFTLENAFAFSIDMPSPPPCQEENPDDTMPSAYSLDKRTCQLTVWTLTLATGKESAASAQEVEEYRALTGEGREERQRFSRDGGGRRLAVRTADSASEAWVETIGPSEYRGILPPRRVAADVRGVAIKCPSTKCQSSYFENLWWSADKRSVIFVAKMQPKISVQGIYEWRPGASDVRTILESNDSLRKCEFLQSRLLCIRQTYTSPDTIVSIDLSNGKIVPLFDPNPSFRNLDFTKVEKHVWKDPYGNTALGHLVYPVGYCLGTRYPLVVTTYRSSGFLRGATGDEQPIHVLAQNGFFVLSLDVPDDEENMAKTEDEVEYEVRASAYPLFRMGPQKALDDMLDRLDKLGLIDPKRVGITGFSFGANVVDTALIHGHRYAAASSAWSPLSPWTHGFLGEHEKNLQNRVFGGEPFGSGLKAWSENSVALQASNINVPFLLQVADREYFWSLANFMALREAGKPVEMYQYANEYHVKWQPRHRYTVYNRNLDWFNFWLRNVENPIPSDRGQYVRWGQLKELQCKSDENIHAYCHQP